MLELQTRKFYKTTRFRAQQQSRNLVLKSAEIFPIPLPKFVFFFFAKVPEELGSPQAAISSGILAFALGFPKKSRKLLPR